jgi:V/A-type H+-transporting ATPase subunit C
VLEKAAELGRAALHGDKLTWFEQECDNDVIRYLSRAKLVSFGVEPVAAHLAALEAEIMSVRMILTGKLSGISPAVIRERLRTSYV